MRLFCPHCGRQLLLEHSIKIDLLSNFTYCEGTITLTKHQIKNSGNIRQKLILEKTTGMFCTSCTKNFTDAETTFCQCDECGNKILVKDIQNIGETIILCNPCLGRYKHFKDFKIFGLRGPDRKTRKKRYDEVIEEVSAARDLPEEIQRIYDGGLEVDSPAPIDDRNRGDRVGIDREQLRHQEFRAVNTSEIPDSTNIWRENFSGTTVVTDGE